MYNLRLDTYQNHYNIIQTVDRNLLFQTMNQIAIENGVGDGIDVMKRRLNTADNNNKNRNNK